VLAVFWCYSGHSSNLCLSFTWFFRGVTVLVLRCVGHGYGGGYGHGGVGGGGGGYGGNRYGGMGVLFL
jgi:hypothetical protein